MILTKMSYAGIFACLLSLSVIPLSSGQLAPTERVNRLEPQETYDNPPAVPQVMQTSPAMISQFNGFTSIQANVNASGQNIVGDAANECSISVDPTNSSKKAIGWRQFN